VDYKTEVEEMVTSIMHQHLLSSSKQPMPEYTIGKEEMLPYWGGIVFTDT